MGRVHQPLLLLATFLIALPSITTSIEGRTTKLGNSYAKNEAAPESERIKAASSTEDSEVNNPIDSIYYPGPGARFEDKATAKEGSTTVNGERSALFLGLFPLGPLGFPFGFGLPLPLPFPFPFPFGIFGNPRGLFGFPRGLWGGYGGFPGVPQGYGAKAEVKGKDESGRSLSP